ncbi:MAG: C40 family peptidase [Bryobacteraceae bacterium]|nr:C40 family peptidase [Bryobacteraceae bacterium]
MAGGLWFLLMGASLSGWVVSDPVAGMYSRPSLDADLVSQAILGTNVQAVEQEPGWVRIRTPDDYLGWTPLSSLRPRESGPYADTGRVVQVRTLFANLYREPDVTRRAPLLAAPFESRLEVVAEPEDDGRRWLQVRLPDGREVWIQRGDVATRSQPVTIDETIAIARRFLGLPYLWGGASSFGYDCSGFTQMLARRRGVVMPRDSGPQARWDGVEPVERDRLQPGDLLFFGKAADKINHTGMYIGNGEFIHATTHLQPVVQISRLDDPHWAELLVACRRLKTETSERGSQ